MSNKMTLEEEMNAMLNGKYTSDIMDDDDMAVYEEENSDGYVHRDEDEDYDEIDEIEAKANGSDEIEDETAGTDDAKAENSEGKTGDNVDEGGEAADESKDATTGENLEDTKASDQADENDDTKDTDVGSDTDTSGTEDDKKTENTQLDEADNKDEKDQKDEADTTGGELDYKQKYEEALKKLEDASAFRDRVTADFKANGKMVKGITDPEKIVKNLQMSTGMTKKLDGYKSIKPYVKPLEDRGLLQDTAKFDMLMKLADGDKEALKHYMNENSIDPIDLDTEDVNYDSSSTIASQEELMFGEMMDTADEYGVGKQFSDTVLSDWDEASAATLFSGSDGLGMSRKLAEQMGNGIYDEVMAIANNMDITEPGFRAKNSLDKYEAASGIYNQQKQDEHQAQQMAKANEAKAAELVAEQARANEAAKIQSAETLRIETEKIAKADEAKAYAAKVAEKERLANEARDLATGVSQNRGTSNNVTETEPQSQDDFRTEWRKLMGR